MKVLVTGFGGQLSTSLSLVKPSDVELITLSKEELNIADRSAVVDKVSAMSPKWIINAAAYTNVDKAEKEVSLAHSINCDAVSNLASVAEMVGARICHISTDFIFSGQSSTPYPVNAAPDPQNVYGKTKLAGEQAAGSDALIVRTSWVYSEVGNNFVKTMLNLFAKKVPVRVVADQIGSPTYARNLAETIWSLISLHRRGLFHYSDSGVASWYDFAVAISEEAFRLNLLGQHSEIEPIKTSEFPTPATRPHYSVLDTTLTSAALGRKPPHWRSSLRQMLKELQRNG
ncbi:dTDP-4-dehydrorhamnose reductase [Parasphingorhabdus sp.]|uniref:dTDP-4-dehydrorhamnose reductase n=1 Tax=Parasphingorhabdus sp. TaxID=2709688 RepID=UPI003A925781